MVATGTYGPKGYAPEWTVPQGAQEASGLDEVTRVAREQISRGADLIKVYADYRWGVTGDSRPTFTLDELRRIVEVAKSSGRPVIAHASTVEGMRRAIEAGVETIEHGDSGTPGDLEADGRTPRRVLSDRRGRRRDGAVRRLEEGRRSRSRRVSPPSASASRRRWTPA